MQDTLIKLWNEARGDFLGSILGWVVIGILGLLAALFRKTILLGIKKIFNLEPAKPPVETPPPAVPLPPQEVVVRFEGASQLQPVNPELSTKASAVPRSTIPRPPLAGFVARRDESGRDLIERLQEELAPEKEQLIVLWGAGGVGKTTLAAETARAMRDVFTDGIIWTTADGKPDFALSTLLDEIATQLGQPDLRQLVAESKEEAVHQLLATASAILIVLDNFETISPAEQDRCAHWLAKKALSPALITSRDEVSVARPVRILAMSQDEAEEFLRRLTSETRNPHVFEHLDKEKIIQATDRIPLVMQWLVRQIDSARQPLAVLEQLSHGKGDAAERVFDRSFELPQLGDDGRAVLLALSLFVPDASREALAEVAGFPAESERLESAVQQLAELWLVQTSESNERLRVEGLTRELAKARLKRDGTAPDWSRRFVAYFVSYARGHEDPKFENHLALDAEKDNLLRATDLAFDLEDWSSVQELGFSIALPGNGWLSTFGYWTETVKINEQALEAARRSNDKRNIAAFAHNLAIVSVNMGEFKMGEALYNESLMIVKDVGDKHALSQCLHQLGVLAHQQGNYAEAARRYDESLEIVTELDDRHGIAQTQHQLGWLAHNEGDLKKAHELYNKSLAIKRELNDERGLSNTLHQLAMLAHEEGDLKTASELYNETLEIKRKLRDQRGIASTVHQLGRLAHDEGRYEQARDRYNESLAIATRLGHQYGIGLNLRLLGFLEGDHGNRREAERLLTQALNIFQRLKLPIADVLQQELKELKGSRGKAGGRRRGGKQ